MSNKKYMVRSIKRGEDFARHGTNLVEQPEAPLKLKAGLTPKLLLLPEFFKTPIADVIYRAKRLTKGRIPCRDKATAIALILGAQGRTI